MPIKTKKNTKGKLDPQKYVLPGPPYNAYRKKIKTQKQKKRQNRPSETRLSGVPPIMPKKPTIKKTQGKIDPQKYVYQGSPP